MGKLKEFASFEFLGKGLRGSFKCCRTIARPGQASRGLAIAKHAAVPVMSCLMLFVFSPPPDDIHSAAAGQGEEGLHCASGWCGPAPSRIFDHMLQQHHGNS
jgi:hypothetical protein